MLKLCASDPDAALELLTVALERDCASATFFDAAVSLVKDSALETLSLVACTAWKKSSESELAESVISYLSLQAPGTLVAHLKEFDAQLPNERAYYSHYPWSAAPPETIMAMANAAPVKDGLRGHAASAVLESRDWGAITKLLSRLRPPRDEAELFLAEHGYTPSGDQLYPSSTFHIAFPQGHIDRSGSPSHLQHFHPTWGLGGRFNATFGGSANGFCGCCQGQLQRIIRWQQVPEGIPVSGPLELVACLSCLGWEEQEMFFRHKDLKATPLNTKSARPEFEAEPLAECEIQLAPTPSRWRRQDWGLSNSRENLNRLGGAPSWVQGAQYPKCPECKSMMVFLMQLDSDLPTASGDEWMWGSGGLGYFFWCDDCRVSGALWQCT